MDKKNRIIEAAAEIVMSDGIKQLTLARVASETLQTKQGVLHYFSNMQELIKALIEWCDDRYLKGYLNRIDTVKPHPGRTPRIYTQTVVETYGDGSNKRDSVAAALYATASKTELAGAAYAVSYDRLKDDCYADGGDVGEALSIITTFDALCLGSAITHRLSPGDRDLIWNNLEQRIKKLEGDV